MTETPDPLPPLNWLRSFEASARLGSFTEAAAELNITQSAISQQIRLLEAHLQQTLFFRQGRSKRLTNAGHDYLFFVREAFDLLRVGTRSVFDPERGQSLTLRANLAFTLFWLMPRLGDLYSLHPWMRLDILPHISDSEERPSKFEIEIVNRIAQAKSDHRPLGDEYFFPVCAPSLLAAGRLDDTPLFDSTSMTATWQRWHQRHPAQPTPKPVNYATTVVVSINAAIAGIGLALAHTSLFDAPEAAGQLVRPFAGQIKMQERYFISEPRAQDLTPASRAFLAWMEAQTAPAVSAPG